MSTTSQHPTNPSPWPLSPRAMSTPVTYGRRQMTEVTCTGGCVLHRPVLCTELDAPAVAARRDADHVSAALTGMAGAA